MQLVPGTLESSNVNIAEAMANMIELARSYDMQIKAMKSAEDNGRLEHQAAADQQLIRTTEVITAMNRALWVAKTGLDAQQTQMAVMANNLANVNTTGYKKGRAVFRICSTRTSRQVGAATSQNTLAPTGLKLGTGVQLVATEKLYTQGNLNQTGNSLDLAINGRGFFQVLMPDGTLGLHPRWQLPDQRDRPGGHRQRLSRCSRRSRFRRARRASPSAPTARSGAAGRADRAVDGRHAAAGGLHQSGRPAAQRRESAGRIGLQRHGADRRSPAVKGMGTLQQGATESSNVDVVEEMVNMIETQRAYEMNTKAIETTDQMLQYLDTNL